MGNTAALGTVITYFAKIFLIQAELELLREEIYSELGVTAKSVAKHIVRYNFHNSDEKNRFQASQ